MIKILLVCLITFNNCFSFDKKLNDRYYEISNNAKTKEEMLLESSIKKYNLNINIKTIKFKNKINNLFEIQTIEEAKKDNNYFMYFNGSKTKHLANKNKMWGKYYISNKIITINKDIISKFNKEKQIGVIAHEIGHMLGLSHYNDKTCNFMLEGEDKCQSYNYKQINMLKDYINGNLSKGDQEKYMFKDDDYLQTIKDLKKNKTITLHLILD